MRIAFSGAHRCGKSTLLESVGERVEGYRVVDEPYAQLEEDGYEFAHPPSLDDFVEQLRCSLALLEDDAPNLLFDRCPVDFLGYLLAHPDAASFDIDEWKEQVRSSVRTLDVIVFVPIEHADRIQVSSSEDSVLRTEVDSKLQWLLLEDPFHFEMEVLVVQGSQRERAEQVVRRMGRGPS